ncbi:MAG: hypothetical protein QOH84_1035 [Kribbellaceae bacterium]|nr:hypothetical protein [Kribbellaceae bacterium]
MALTKGQVLKLVWNAVNLSTVVGVLVGGIGRVEFSRGPRGLLYGTGYKLSFPVATAFTIGNVILSKHDRAYFDARPVLVKHEERHSWQYFWLLGLPMLPLYLLGTAWSWLRTGCRASRNPFERLANLADGNYDEKPVRPLGQILSQTFRRG